MQTDVYRLWSTKIVTFAISALATASVVYWGLKGWGPHAPSTAPAMVAAQVSPVNSQAIARALGGGLTPAAAVSGAAPAISRYALVGVVAGRFRPGAALISVDGQEARPVRVGTLVEDGMMLESVSGRSAILSSTTSASGKFSLELPHLNE
ncbi:type II secretion system protein N [Polaromonas sp.]|uniref:type II secretion system protein N n=1 Tax=Polaromonas sp. TaxID=1869339 RepID=UPI001A1B11D3|nr:general secretion pathway protein C [Burkholderiales bacterium]